MIYIAIAIGILFLVLLHINDYDFDEVAPWIASVWTLIWVVALVVALGEYNTTKSTVDKKIAVLQEQNETVISQIEPLVNKYLEYESDTYKELKMDVNNIVALSQYPQLKGNEFIKSQIDIVTRNQAIITKLKLDKAALNSYKMWIFMGE